MTEKKKAKKKPKKVSPDKLPTRKEQAFIDNFCTNGFNARQAMRDAKYKGSDNVLSVTANRLLKKPNILKRINDYQQRKRDELNATKEEKLQLLSEIMRNKDCIIIPPKHEGGLELLAPAVPFKDRINAIKEHNVMEGHHSETKIKHSGSISGDRVITFAQGIEEVRKDLKNNPSLKDKIEDELMDD